MRKSLGHLIVSAAVLFTASSMYAASNQAAIASKALPMSALKKMRAHAAPSSSALSTFATTKPGLSKFAATTGLPGVDSLTNWSDSFTAAGYDGLGNAQSVWPYTMVGTPPESGQTTVLKAPIVPVTVDLLAPDGTIAIFNGQPLSFGPDKSIIQATVGSPEFQPFIYTNGVGQFNDQMFRAEFADRI